MNRSRSIKAAVFGGLAALMFAVCVTGCLNGCSSTPNTVAYKSVATSWDVVTAAKGGWDSYVADQAAAGTPVSAAAQAQVAAAYAKTRAAFVVACDAGAAWSAAVQTNAPATTAAGLQGLYTQAGADLAAEVSDIQLLITTLKTAAPAPAASGAPVDGNGLPEPTSPRTTTTK